MRRWSCGMVLLAFVVSTGCSGDSGGAETAAACQRRLATVLEPLVEQSEAAPDPVGYFETAVERERRLLEELAAGDGPCGQADVDDGIAAALRNVGDVAETLERYRGADADREDELVGSMDGRISDGTGPGSRSATGLDPDRPATLSARDWANGVCPSFGDMSLKLDHLEIVFDDAEMAVSYDGARDELVGALTQVSGLSSRLVEELDVQARPDVDSDAVEAFLAAAGKLRDEMRSFVEQAKRIRVEEREAFDEDVSSLRRRVDAALAAVPPIDSRPLRDALDMECPDRGSFSA